MQVDTPVTSILTNFLYSIKNKTDKNISSLLVINIPAKGNVKEPRHKSSIRLV